MTLRGKFLAVSPAVILAAVLAFTATVRAQSEPAAPPPPPGGEMGHGPMPPGDPVGFLGFEAGIDKKTVTGAPFTATFTNQSTHVLADGNRIVHSTSGTLARDGQGRTRRDVTLPAIGPWADSSKPAPHMILLNDPVAGTHYMLNPDRKVARKVPAFRLEQHGRQGGRQAFAQKQQSEVATTSLGTQTIAGVTAQGTRSTRTIPAGAIGNEKPIVIVNERWYSPDLQMVVMSKHSDPRMGDTVYQVTNVQRQEPNASLFQVPSDYTVKAANNPGFQGARGQHGARPMASPPAENGPAEPPPPQE